MALIPVRPVINVKNVLKHLVTEVVLQKLWTLVGHLVDSLRGAKLQIPQKMTARHFYFKSPQHDTPKEYLLRTVF